ncbi:MAG: ABC transporter ATP-binding protein [Planctomycetes bacterium]|nr:ABC transporter ATP-binding protein [Planctomycetota bacterium]
MTTALQFDRIVRHFLGRAVLADLTFQVRAGEAFALLGRNGSGKTTALRILLGFLEPHSGRSTILGADSRSLDPATRDRIGYVCEGVAHFEHLTLTRVLDYENATRPRFDRDLALRTLSRHALNTRVPLRKLSRGQRALVALALATAGRPEVLVYDDPAMGLDVVHRHELIQGLAEILAEQGIALLFSSHILADVERMADRVGILAKGRLVVDAPLDVLRRRVQRRTFRPKPGASTNGTLGAHVPCILSSRETAGGFTLTLVDCDAEQERRLRGDSEVLTDPEPLNLEELFVEFTSDPHASALHADKEVSS